MSDVFDCRYFPQRLRARFNQNQMPPRFSLLVAAMLHNEDAKKCIPNPHPQCFHLSDSSAHFTESNINGVLPPNLKLIIMYLYSIIEK